MTKEQNKLSISLLHELKTSGAGYDVLRYISLPKLLGTEASTLLYFMGKDLARSFEIQSYDDIYEIADQLGWGKIELVKEKKHTLTFTLMADAVVYRLNAPINVDFRLEAGFLAKAVSMIKGNQYECSEKVNKKIYQVEFKVVSVRS